MEAITQKGLIEVNCFDTDVFTVIGLYLNADFYKVNGVIGSHLFDNYQYNTTFRMGRAYFINGVCFYPGYYGTCAKAQWVFNEHEANLKSIKRKFCTAPYV
tara:strand:+ start:130 stop:432 length:303 start_codon:yes stop_codon:yes gene_type:complete